ncbi:hypothetical protein BDD12DRAFT_918432 [Trichophaea hybrida]|nr:hypothetical protein BDD12DRAFT_918432 [Trichophaea hybrida]
MTWGFSFGRAPVPVSIDQRVEGILERTPLIDTHVDLPILIRGAYSNKIYGENFTFREELMGHVDLPRLRKGRVGGCFGNGKVASMIGAEGLHQIGNSASVVRMYHTLGVRYITLTHACNNKYADGAAAPDGSYWNGLSPAGELMIKEMNRVGMMVDLSHVTEATMKDVLKVTKAPVIFSHSSAYALCPHPRNVPDDVLRSVKSNGGVVQVNFYNRFIHCKPGENPEDATLAHVVDHIQYIGDLIGWDHVGIGADYDGIEITPKGLEDVSHYPDLFKELLSRGVTDEQARKVAGENILRVWKETEKIARKMQIAGAEVLEDDV